MDPFGLAGTLGRGPTIIGTWVGGFTYSDVWSVLFLAIGAGALFQSAIRLLKKWRLNPFNHWFLFQTWWIFSWIINHVSDGFICGGMKLQRSIQMRRIIYLVVLAAIVVGAWGFFMGVQFQQGVQ